MAGFTRPFSDYLNQETLNKLRGIQQESPDQSSISDFKTEDEPTEKEETPIDNSLSPSAKGMGIASGVAALGGSPLAPALLGTAGGLQMGQQQVKSDVDENGMSSVPLDKVFDSDSIKMQGNKSPALTEQQLKSLQSPDSSSINPEIPSDYSSLMKKDSTELESNTPDQRVAAKLAAQTKGIHGTAPDSVSPNSAPGQGFTNNTVAGLQAAQDETNKQKNLADLRSAAAMIMSGQQGLQHHTLPPSIEAELKLDESQKKGAEDITSQFQARGEQEKNDPNSAASVQARQTARAMLSQAGLKINIPENVSANDLEKRFGNFTKMADTTATNQARKDMLSEKEKDRAAMLQVAGATKATDTQNKIYNKTMNDITTYRGAKDVGNAAEALRNSDNAMALIKLNPDYNNMSNEQYGLLSAEIAKIATGGVATAAATKDAKASTLQSKAAHFWSEMKGNPTPAQLGGFIQQNKDYLMHLNDINHNIVTNFKQAKLAGSFDTFSNEQKQNALLQHPDVAKNLGITEDQLNDPNFEVPKFGNLVRDKNNSKSSGQSPTQSKPLPGSIVNYKGKKYRVGSDGDSLEEIQ